MAQSARSAIFDHVATLLGALQQAPGQVHVRVWAEMSPWLRDLMRLASVKWLQRLAADVKCHVHRSDTGACGNAAVLYCLVCHHPTCVRHAFIDSSGEGVCFVCASEQIHAQGHVPKDRAEPPPQPISSDEDIGWARKTLKIKAGASWDDVRSAHRKQSAKHHPDKVQNAEDKKKAEAKFKDVQRAFDVLKLHYGKDR